MGPNWEHCSHLWGEGYCRSSAVLSCTSPTRSLSMRVMTSGSLITLQLQHPDREYPLQHRGQAEWVAAVGVPRVAVAQVVGP